MSYHQLLQNCLDPVFVSGHVQFEQNLDKSAAESGVVTFGCQILHWHSHQLLYDVQFETGQVSLSQILQITSRL